MPVTWNLSPHRLAYVRADVLVLSVGKSGRTWLRVLLNKYLAEHFGVAFGIDDLRARNHAIPSILYDHEMWSHYCDASWLDRVLGANIAPPSVLRRKKVVLVYRDPRDVVVSMYFHKTRRSRRRMNIDISRFIHDPHFGVGNIVRVMNLWRARLADHPQCLWLRYEDMKADPGRELRRLLAFIGIEQPRSDLVDEAVRFASFENMKKMEAENSFGSAILSARNVADPDSFKVREGSSGGYVKHFQEADLHFLADAVRALDGFYGYSRADAA